jgi:hypothetical protein
MVDTDQEVLKTNIRAGTEWEVLSLIKNKDAITVCDATPYARDYTAWRHRIDAREKLKPDNHSDNYPLGIWDTPSTRGRKLGSIVAHIFPLQCKQ